MANNDYESSAHNALSFDIDQKISFNNLSTSRGLIEEFSAFSTLLDSLYNAADQQSPGMKTRVLTNMKIQYRKKTMVVPELSKTDILSSLISDLKSKLATTTIELPKEVSASIYDEDLETCAVIIVCHAFMNCKIMDRPVSC